jgi:hypothetical protein
LLNYKPRFEIITVHRITFDPWRCDPENKEIRQGVIGPMRKLKKDQEVSMRQFAGEFA